MHPEMLRGTPVGRTLFACGGSQPDRWHALGNRGGLATQDESDGVRASAFLWVAREDGNEGSDADERCSVVNGGGTTESRC